MDHAGAKASSLQVARPEAQTLVVKPWPFDVDRIDVTFPFRRVSAKPFADQTAFLNAYQAAAVEHFTCAVTAG